MLLMLNYVNNNSNETEKNQRERERERERESGVIVLFCLVEGRETVPLPEIWFQVKLC
jgi:hypothetical protein